jgi:hypothetical protein
MSITSNASRQQDPEEPAAKAATEPEPDFEIPQISAHELNAVNRGGTHAGAAGAMVAQPATPGRQADESGRAVSPQSSSSAA